jgi:hypothetical protein
MNATNATQILVECQRRRITLAPNGPRLVVKSIGELPPDFERVLIHNKAELVALLNSIRHMAKQILLDEFEDLNGRQYGDAYRALTANLSDPLCRMAFDHLRIIAQRTKWTQEQEKP